MSKKPLKDIISGKLERLNAYLKREAYMLSVDGVQSYGVGTRNVQRYSTDLAEIRKAIKELEQEISELESRQSGNKPRHSATVIARDI